MPLPSVLRPRAPPPGAGPDSLLVSRGSKFPPNPSPPRTPGRLRSQTAWVDSCQTMPREKKRERKREASGRRRRRPSIWADPGIPSDVGSPRPARAPHSQAPPRPCAPGPATVPPPPTHRATFIAGAGQEGPERGAQEEKARPERGPARRGVAAGQRRGSATGIAAAAREPPASRTPGAGAPHLLFAAASADPLERF